MLNALLVLLLVALGIVLIRRESFGPKANLLMGGLAALSLVCVVAKVVVARNARSPQRALGGHLAFYSAAATKLGQTIAAALPGGGEVLVIHAVTNPIDEAVVKARIQGLKKGFGNVPLTLNEVSLPEEARYGIEMGLPLDVFLKYAGQAPAAKAVVSFVGPPAPGRVSGRALPPLYILESLDRLRAQELLREGVIAAAVVVKDKADFTTPASAVKSEDELFNLRYELITSGR